MTVSKDLVAALSPIGLPVELDVYTGSKSAYITVNYDLIPAQVADNRPLFWRALIQVHLVCPLDVSFSAWREGVLTALATGGYSVPEIVDATDDTARHLVFETETITKMEV